MPLTRDVDTTNKLAVGVYTDTVLPRLDGIAVSLEASCSALRELGINVEVIAPRTVRGSDSSLLVRGVRSMSPWGRDYRVALIFPLLFRHSVSARRYDVIHVHTLGPIGLTGLYAGWRANIPVVLSWHTDLLAYQNCYPEIRVVMKLARLAWFIGIGRPKHYDRRANLSSLARIVAAVDLIVVPSAKSYRQVERFCTGVLTTLLPSPTLPLSRPIITPDVLRRKLGITQNAHLILSVGRLSQEKSPALLLRAFALLRTSQPDVRLVMVGSIRRRRRLVKLMRNLGIEAAVSFPGSVSRDQLGAYYATASIFVIASVTETQSLVAQEAEAFGLPVIVVDEELTEGVGTQRWLAGPSPAELSSAMEACLRRKARESSDTCPDSSMYCPPASDHALSLLAIYRCLSHATSQGTYS